MPHVTVEFFGIPRARVQVSGCELDADTVGDALAQLQDPAGGEQRRGQHARTLR